MRCLQSLDVLNNAMVLLHLGISAQIGRITGRDVSGNFRVLYTKELLYCIVVLLSTLPMSATSAPTWGPWPRRRAFSSLQVRLGYCCSRTARFAASIMGTLAVPKRLRWGGWTATVVMAAASMGFLISLVMPRVQ